MRLRNCMLTTGVALLVQAFPLTVNAAAAQQCSSKTTIGRYLVVCDGFLSPAPNSALVPAKQLATATADESGTFKSTDGILSLGGLILHSSVIGTEILKPDCTGNITYAQSINGQAAGSIHLSFVVSNNGNAIDGFSTDPGTVFSCHLTRIGAEE